MVAPKIYCAGLYLLLKWQQKYVICENFNCLSQFKDTALPDNRQTAFLVIRSCFTLWVWDPKMLV